MQISKIFKKKALRNGSGQPRKKISVLASLQTLGRSLIYPIAILPFAALMNRLGTLGLSFSTSDGSGNLSALIPGHEAGYWIGFIIQKPGSIVFDNIDIFFALGVAFAVAKDNRGEAALVGYFVLIIVKAFNAENGIATLIYSDVITRSATLAPDGSGPQVSKLLYGEGNTGGAPVYTLNVGVFGGIVSGLVAAAVYNKFRNTKLHPALAFFGGRRFVPMVAGLVAVPLAVAFSIIWPWIQYVLVLIGNFLSSSGDAAAGGAFVYGFINRIMQPFGLHHILNTFLWFQLPITGPVVEQFNGNIVTSTVTVNGDINAFNQRVATSGIFQAGFFPVFLGGEPGAAFAMIMAVKAKQKRKEMWAFFSGVAFVAFLTGIDEPLVFSFVFLSPLLWIFYGLITGICAAIVVAMQIRIGFGFSAGFIDWAISIPNSWGISEFIGNNVNGAASAVGYSVVGQGGRVISNTLWVWPISALSFLLFFVTFYPSIIFFDIKTPGRELELTSNSSIYGKVRKLFHMKPFMTQEQLNLQMAAADAAAASVEQVTDFQPTGQPVSAEQKAARSANFKNAEYERISRALVDIIGPDNFVNVDNCTTRLRLIVKDNDPTKINDAKIKALKMGFQIVRLKGKDTLQVIVGSDVQFVADGVKTVLTEKGKVLGEN
ncbi:PTS transporter subunit EIIC [[Mycoplasma] testudinis]|uniref:PTS transporter subunit EIIC n=1 Tax=[Mycoplasma] testudinis TaxID=33924 RepID=UPI0006989F87|nr:PTS transporter subunit EIIC [[Mycoplasma] testudinis]